MNPRDGAVGRFEKPLLAAVLVAGAGPALVAATARTAWQRVALATGFRWR